MSGTRNIDRSQATSLSVLEFALVALVILTLIAAAWISARPTRSDVGTRVVRVSPGDSLWSIAQRHQVPGRSTAETVEILATMNGLESSKLVAGAELRVPSRADDGALAMR